MRWKILKITTDALVIRESTIGDNDRLVTLMSKDLGVFKAFASGAKSVKSKRGSATGLLSFSNFHLEKKGDTYRILEATANRMFFGAGSDVETLSLAQYFCELSAFLCPSGEDAEEFLRLILNSLHFLTEKKKSPYLIKAITELRIASISGYTPNLIACDGCGKYEDSLMYFEIEDANIYCSSCGSGKQAMPVTADILKAMRHIVYSKFESIYGFDIPEESAKTLSKITEKYIIRKTEHGFKTLDFYNSIVGTI